MKMASYYNKSYDNTVKVTLKVDERRNLCLYFEGIKVAYFGDSEDHAITFIQVSKDDAKLLEEKGVQLRKENGVRVISPTYGCYYD